MNKKHRIIRVLTVLILTFSIIVNYECEIFAVGNTNFEDVELEEEFVVENENGNIVEVTIDEDALNNISMDDVEQLCEINSDEDCIEIESADSFNELDETPSQVSIVLDDGDVVNVNVDEDCVEDVTPEEVLDLVESNEVSSFDTINIDEVQEIDYENSSSLTTINLEETYSDVSPQWKWYDLVVYITTTQSFGSEYVKKDSFIASAARGETYTLTKKFSESISLSVESGAAYDSVSAKAGLKNSVSYSVEKKHQYKGPSESSKYNCREYRVKFYAKKCTVKQAVKGLQSGHTTPYEVKYVVPSKYLSYSIDKKL